MVKSISILFFILVSFSCVAQQNSWTHVSMGSGANKKTGILNINGKLIVPIQYEMIIGGNGFYYVKENNFWGVYNSEGENFIPAMYEDIGFKISDTLVRVMKKDKWGFVNFKNETRIDFKYDFACNFDEGRAYVRSGTNNFYIDKQGNTVSTTSEVIKYCAEDGDTDVQVTNQFQDGILAAKKENDKYGVIEVKTNKVIIPFKYDEIGRYFHNTILVRLGNKWGAYTDTGKLITDPVYDSIGIFWYD